MKCCSIQVLILILSPINSRLSVIGKKVVIVGEMSENAFRLASEAASSSSSSGGRRNLPSNSASTSVDTSIHLQASDDLHSIDDGSHLPSEITGLSAGGSEYTGETLLVPVNRYSMNREREEEEEDDEESMHQGVMKHATAVHMTRRIRPSLSESNIFPYGKKSNVMQYTHGQRYAYAPSRSKSIASSYNSIHHDALAHNFPSSSSSSSFYFSPRTYATDVSSSAFDSSYFFTHHPSDLHAASSSDFSSSIDKSGNLRS